MEIITAILLAVGLSMDALAVSISNGLCYAPIDRKKALLIGLYFGGFQCLMPLIGWFLGKSVRSYISVIDHWIAFALLLYIGGSMSYSALKNGAGDEPPCDRTLTHKRLLLQAVATSIDALAAGISLAFLELNVFVSVSIIGVVTFVLSVSGALLGKRLGKLFRKRAEIVGGLILIALGIKILIEHLLQGTGI